MSNFSFGPNADLTEAVIDRTAYVVYSELDCSTAWCSDRVTTVSLIDKNVMELASAGNSVWSPFHARGWIVHGSGKGRVNHWIQRFLEDPEANARQNDLTLSLAPRQQRDQWILMLRHTLRHVPLTGGHPQFSECDNCSGKSLASDLPFRLRALGYDYHHYPLARDTRLVAVCPDKRLASDTNP